MTTLTNEPGDPTTELAKLIADASTPAPARDGLRLGYVTGLSPLRVQYPGDLAPLNHTPLSTVADLAVADQVVTTNIDQRIVVVGVIRPILPHTYSQDLSAASYNDTNTVFTQTIPAQRRACRVQLRFDGHQGFSATSGITAGLTGSTTAGTLTAQSLQLAYLPNGARWTPYVWVGHLDLAAGVAATVTIRASVSGGANCYFTGMLRSDVLTTGEFA